MAHRLSQVEAAVFVRKWGPCSRRTWQRWEAANAAPKWVYLALKDYRAERRRG